MSEARTEPTGSAFLDVGEEHIYPLIQEDYAAVVEKVPVRVLAASAKQQEKAERKHRTQ